MSTKGLSSRLLVVAAACYCCLRLLKCVAHPETLSRVVKPRHGKPSCNKPNPNPLQPAGLAMPAMLIGLNNIPQISFMAAFATSLLSILDPNTNSHPSLG